MTSKVNRTSAKIEIVLPKYGVFAKRATRILWVIRTTIGAVGGREGCNIVASAVQKCSEVDMDQDLLLRRSISISIMDEIGEAEADHETCVCT